MMPLIRPINADQALPFRRDMLWPGKPLSHVRVPGDDAALHLGAWMGGDLVGVASFFPGAAAAQLRKLAVAPALRRRGLGARLVLHGAAAMQDLGQSRLWCDARQSAIAFYAGMGFTIDTQVYVKSGVTYVRAERPLHDLPQLI